VSAGCNTENKKGALRRPQAPTLDGERRKSRLKSALRTEAASSGQSGYRPDELPVASRRALILRDLALLQEPNQVNKIVLRGGRHPFPVKLQLTTSKLLALRPFDGGRQIPQGASLMKVTCAQAKSFSCQIDVRRYTGERDFCRGTELTRTSSDLYRPHIRQTNVKQSQSGCSSSGR
jgi:hypothetical protein